MPIRAVIRGGEATSRGASAHGLLQLANTHLRIDVEKKANRSTKRKSERSDNPHITIHCEDRLTAELGVGESDTGIASPSPAELRPAGELLK